MGKKDPVSALGDLIDANHLELMRRWAERVRLFAGARGLDRPALLNRMQEILREISESLRSGEVRRDDLAALTETFKSGPRSHGAHRVESGFDVVEVVAEYNVLRDVIREFSEEHRVAMAGDVGYILNRVISDATALAVESYVNEKNAREELYRREQLSFVMHDLKTPLSAISTAAHTLDKLGMELEPERTAKIFDMLQRNVQRMNAMLNKTVTDQALNETTITANRNQLELWPLVESILDGLRPLAEANRNQLVNEIPRDLTVLGDPNLLTATYQNLLSNAIKFTHGGKITIGARVDEYGGIQSWVSDTGAGIPSNYIPRIFDKFETTGEDQSGHGLGLAIVKKAVEAHGGSVTVDSKVGAGSTFRFYIPVHRDPAA